MPQLLSREELIAQCLERLESGNSLFEVLKSCPDDPEVREAVILASELLAVPPAPIDPEHFADSRERFMQRVRQQLTRDPEREGPSPS